MTIMLQSELLCVVFSHVWCYGHVWYLSYTELDLLFFLFQLYVLLDL